MAAPVYSTRFISSTDLSTGPTYTVPAGYRAVVRDVSCTLSASGPTSLYFYIANAVVWISKNCEPGTDDGPHWSGRAVANAGDVIKVVATNAVHGQASGYLLLAP